MHFIRLQAFRITREAVSWRASFVHRTCKAAVITGCAHRLVESRQSGPMALLQASRVHILVAVTASVMFSPLLLLFSPLIILSGLFWIVWARQQVFAGETSDSGGVKPPHGTQQVRHTFFAAKVHSFSRDVTEA